MKVCVIGGGASGLACAIAAAKSGAETVLFEKNRSEKTFASEKFFDNAYLGKKLLITGKGRCNVTNDCTLEEFLKNVPVNSKFLYASYNALPPQKLMHFFEDGGTAVKVERGNRVFPVSDKSIDILRVLKEALRENDVKVINKKITDVSESEGKFTSVTDEDGKTYSFESCVVCTGGLSYPITGSDGDGYRFAQKTGHTLKETKPSLVPLTSQDVVCAQMQGLSLRNVTVNVVDNKNKKKIYSCLGEMLFTHFGMSGPLILSASSHMREMEPDRYTVSIDLKPSLDEKTLDNRVLSDFAKYINRDLDNALSDLLPNKMIHPFLSKCGLDCRLKPNSVTKEQRRIIVDTLKGFNVKVSGFRPVSEAIITSGGVSTKNVNPSTMESKIIKGLYFAGEVLDVDAYTGGFNLQIAFSTGYLAGINASKISEE